MKQNIQRTLLFSLFILLLLSVLYFYFTGSIEGVDAPTWTTTSFTPLTDKEIKDGKAINPSGNGSTKLSGDLPGAKSQKQSNCLIINDDLKFSASS
jgi:hypothetical protein